jgi:hypothetical protein
VFIQDSSSTTGAGLTGLVFNSAGLTCYYALPRAAAVSVTLATLAAVTSAYSSGGFKEIDATNMPGWYRLDIPDAALASGRFVGLHLKGATNMAPLPLEIELSALDNQDGVRGGLTALPNAAAAATGGLACLVAFGGTATAGGATSVTLPSPASTVADFYKGLEVSIVGGTGAGQSAIITAYSTGRVATVSKAWATNPDNTSVVEVRDIAGPPLDTNLKVVGVVLTDTVTTYTGNTPQTGDNFARLGAPVGASISADIAGVQSDTDNIQTRLPAALVSGRMDSSVGAYASGLTPLQPTVAGRTLDVSTTGEAGLDFDNIKDATGAHTLTNITVPVAASVMAVGTGAIVAGSFAVDSLTSGAMSNGMADEIADHVWDEVLSGHLTAGTTGAALNAASSAGDPWATALPGAYGVGTAGKIIGDNVDAAISTRATPAQVNAEVVDALNVDTYAEPSAVPAATATLTAKIGWLMALARNKITQTATTQTLRNSGDTANIAQSTDSDDGATYTRGGWV